jgi:hypothetical protein
MGLAPRVGWVFFPLDEELALLPGSLTPRQQEHLVHLASWMPFERAAQMLHALLGVQVSEATVRRWTEQAGAHYEAVQTAQSQEPDPEETAAPVPLKQAISTDGAYVPLVSGDWAEARTLAIGQAETHMSAKGEEQIKVSQVSYFSRMTDADTFEQLAEGEIRRRGVREAQAICAVTDGAVWLQEFIDLHRPDAVRIVDFPHAAEYVSGIGERVRASGRHLPRNWLEGVLHRLKHEGLDRVLLHLSRLGQRCQDQELDKKLRYLVTRRDLMQYPLYQQAGWPIGSGTVESANKLVMQTRLKGAGMRWAPEHVNPMLALRTAVCNQRWAEAWQEIVSQDRHHRTERFEHRASVRLQHLVSSWMLLLLQFRPSTSKPIPKPPVSLAPAATLPGPSRPSPHDLAPRYVQK